MMRAFFLAIFAAFIATAALADADRLTDPVQEARAVQLQKQFRCLVCQGESLDESNAQLASDLRHLIRAKIAAGESDDDITAYLVSRYGDFILMKPPLEPGTWLLWFGPLAVLLLGGGIAAMAVMRARKRSSPDINY